MKNLPPLLALLALAFLAAFTPPQVARAQTARPLGCGCPAPTYLRTSSSVTLTGEDYVEVDNDAGLPITVTLTASPSALQRVEVWLTSQASSALVDVNTNGQAVTFTGGADLQLTAANEGVVFLFVQPTPTGGGYWRASAL